MYFGATCPSAPHKLFGDSPWVEAIVGVALSLVGCALVLGCFVVKSKLEREPDVTVREWARRAWAAVVKWVQMRVSKEGRVELALASRADKYMRAHPQKEVEWTPALVASLADASALTEMDIPLENLDKVQVARGETETRIEFFPQRRVVPSLKCHERARDGDVVVFTKLPIPWVPPSVAAPDILRRFVYFEITVTALAPSTTFAVGLARRPFPPFRLPGRHAGSIGYHSSSGLVHCRQPEPAFFYWLPKTSHALPRLYILTLPDDRFHLNALNGFSCSAVYDVSTFGWITVKKQAAVVTTAEVKPKNDPFRHTTDLTLFMPFWMEPVAHIISIPPALAQLHLSGPGCRLLQSATALGSLIPTFRPTLSTLVISLLPLCDRCTRKLLEKHWSPSLRSLTIRGCDFHDNYWGDFDEDDDGSGANDEDEFDEGTTLNYPSGSYGLADLEYPVT
ncbi:hypothetical protein GGF32_002901 [Allomyces javanicus]|nr:hypothetical protein GGF32_002901 [Allomyces javanicus]